ncbi:MAG: UDP-3-O-acyl-N-acetylglucosamine deacetylase [candidate division WOR-3 bacterium]
MRQSTIKTTQEYQGWGIIFQRPVKIRIHPAPINTGIVFNQNISADVNNVFIYNHFVGLKKNRSKIFFVEHFLSACFGLGLDNLYVDVLGKELPFGDGSALDYVKLIRKAEIISQNKPKRQLFINQPISVVNKTGWILVIPSDELSINLLSKASTIGKNQRDKTIQMLVWNQGKKDDYQKSIAPARTFGEYSDIDFLKKILPFPIITQPITDINKKANISNIVLPKRLRYNDEMLRHKMLDLIGDLALLGKWLKAKIIAFNTSHKLNHKLIQQLSNLS